MNRALTITVLGAALASGPAPAADDATAAALALADETGTVAEAAKDWKGFAEFSLVGVQRRAGDAEGRHAQRVSLDLAYDTRWARDWRLSVANRYDGLVQQQANGARSINTLKEAFVSWQPEQDRAFDAGRINVRNGVAAGYNPTDYFRSGAVRSVVSAAPSSLRENRLGSVMLRGQRLWDGGSLTGLYSPRLARHASDEAFDPDFGATNHEHRWQLALSQRLNERWAPQFLLTGTAGQPVRLGASANTLLGDSAIAYAEWSGGRERTQISRALGSAGREAFRHRLAAGVTLTTSTKLAVSAELEVNQAAPNRSQWAAFGGPQRSVYGAWVQDQQEIATREAWFVIANWQDAGVRHLDATGFIRYNPYDHSRMAWVEARYHFSKADLALQWQGNFGRDGSGFGSIPQRQSVTASLTLFF